MARAGFECRLLGGAALLADEQTAAQKAYGDIAPALADLSDRMLSGVVRKRPALSKRDPSLVTVAALVAGYRHNELPGHVARVLANRVKREELAGIVTHLAFYAGWPAANTAVPILREAFTGDGCRAHGPWSRRATASSRPWPLGSGSSVTSTGSPV